MTALVLFALTVVCGLIFVLNRSEVYRIYDSPKGKYHLVVYSVPSIRMFLPTTPGDGGSKNGTGFVRLYDNYGRLYGEAKVSWLQEVDSAEEIVWGEDVVMSSGDDGFSIKMPKE